MDVVIRSEAAAKRVARFGVGANLNSLSVAETLGPRVADIAQRAGRDPRAVGLTLQGAGFLAKDEERARDLARPYMEEDIKQYLQYWAHSNDAVDRKLTAMAREAQDVGELRGSFTVAALIDSIRKHVEVMAGTGLKPNWVNLSLWPAGMPVEHAIECLERVARDVLPHVPRTRITTREI